MSMKNLESPVADPQIAPHTPALDAGTLPVRSRSLARYWEIDTLRGLAVVTMVVYHTLWDLWYLDVLPNIVLWDGFWKYFQRATASTFILLMGVSIAVLNQRAQADSRAASALPRRLVLRGARIFAWGLLLTLLIRISAIGRLDFGILHLLGIAMIAAVPFRRLAWTNIIVWLALFVAGGSLQAIDAPTLWLVPLGLAPAGYAPLDYFPLVPWFGVVLLGIGAANLLYGPRGRRFALPDFSTTPPVPFLQMLGRHSLAIYLLHQPLLWAAFALTGIARF